MCLAGVEMATGFCAVLGLQPAGGGGAQTCLRANLEIFVAK